MEAYLEKFGLWQLIIFIAATLYQFPIAMQTFALAFYVPDSNFWCAQPDGFAMDAVAWKELSSPHKVINEETIIDVCRINAGIYDFANHLNQKFNKSQETRKLEMFQDYMQIFNGTSNETTACTAWEYDTSEFTKSMTEQFNLVCERGILVSTSNAIFMVGNMLGSVVFGYISDRFGRRKTSLYLIGVILILNILITVSPEFIFFMILRALLAACSHGLAVVILVLFAESCSERSRATLGNLVWISSGVGIALLAAMAYGIRNWQHMQTVITVSYIPLGILTWFLPESPRWLMTKNRISEAMDMIKQAARWNRFILPEDAVLKAAIHKEYVQKCQQEGTKTTPSIIDLFRHYQLRWKTLNLFFCWVANSFLYFGLTFGTNQLVGNPFWNLAISGLLEVPATIIAAFTTLYIGRKYPLSFFMIVAGAACTVSIFLPNHLLSLQIVFPMLGKLFITTSFCILIVYSLELYPTVMRNIAFGVCVTISGIASALAPYTKELAMATHKYVPAAIYGTLALGSGLTILLLPETKNQVITDSLDDALIMYGKKKKPVNHAGDHLRLEAIT